MDLTQSEYAVLVVEDEALIRMLAADFLDEAGVPYFEAGDAEEALNLLEAHSDIGVLFTDVNMPGSMDGVALATTVHDQRPDVGIIITSGKRDYSSNEIPACGTFVPKPYACAQLIDVVNEKLALFSRLKNNGQLGS